MLAYQHSGFSVDAGVCIEAHERAALERLLRYCARPPFAMDRLRKQGSDLVYRCAKQNSEPASDKRGIKAHELNSHATGADSPHCGPGATATHPSASLLRCAGTELAAEGKRDSHGAGSTGATGLQWAKPSKTSPRPLSSPHRPSAHQRTTWGELYYVAITAKLRRNGLNRDVGEADSSTAVPHDPGIS